MEIGPAMINDQTKTFGFAPYAATAPPKHKGTTSPKTVINRILVFADFAFSENMYREYV